MVLALRLTGNYLGYTRYIKSIYDFWPCPGGFQMRTVTALAGPCATTGPGQDRHGCRNGTIVRACQCSVYPRYIPGIYLGYEK